MLYKARANKIALFVVLVFWAGLFEYLGKEIVGIWLWNSHKLLVLGCSLLLARKQLLTISGSNDKAIYLFFGLFSFFFWVSHLINNGDIIVDAYWYLYSYGFPLLFYCILKNAIANQDISEYLKTILLQVLYVQIFLSVVKIIIFLPAYGNAPEFNVGSLAYGGASEAVTVPILAVILFWLIKKGGFSQKDWVIACAFLLIALASGKRSPVFIYPLALIFLFAFVRKSIRLATLFKISAIAILLFILGVKLVPTLNPEGQVWGSFDMAYAIEYVQKYTFGTTDPTEILKDRYFEGKGRGASVAMLFEPSRLRLNTAKELLFGKGFTEVKEFTGSERFTGSRSAYDIDHSGLAGEFSTILYGLGYPALLFLVLFGYAICGISHDKKLTVLLFAFFTFDLFLYKAVVLFGQASSIICIFICYYSNIIMQHEKLSISNTVS